MGQDSPGADATAARTTIRYGEPLGGRRKPLALNGFDAIYTTLPRVLVYERQLDPDALIRGLERALAEFPYVSGRQQPTTPPSIADSNDGVLFLTEHHDEPLPFRGLDTAIKKHLLRFAPIRPMRGPQHESPLFLAKLNQFRNGSILGLVVNHALTDGDGFWQFVHAWARAASGAGPDGTLEPVFDRGPMLANLTLGRERPSAHMPFDRHRGPPPVAELPTTSFVFRLDAGALDRFIDEGGPGRAGEATFSRQDAVAAFIWTLVASAQRDGDERHLSLVFNARKALELGAGYIGNAIVSRTVSMGTAEFGTCVLEELARKLRALSHTVTREAVSEDLAFCQSRLMDGTLASYVNHLYQLNLGSGLLINNTTSFPLSDIDFGSGPPSWYDLPHLALNRMIILHESLGAAGGIEVHATLPRDEHGRLLETLTGHGIPFGPPHDA